MKQQLHKENSNKGQTMIIGVISLCLVLLSVSFTQLFIGYSEYSQSQFDYEADQALQLAESGIDNAIEQYLQDNTYTGGTIQMPVGTAQVTLSVNNGVNPPQVTLTSVATYLKIQRSETAVFSVNPPPTILDKAAFAQNNIYAQGVTFNGEIFTNNDFNIYSTQLNGDLFSGGKGNGQKNYFSTNSTLNQYQGAGGTFNAWNPTYIQNSSTINGNVNYHTTVSVDGSSKVTGTTTKQGNNFIPLVANPTFNFAQAQTVATQNGTYYSSPNAFSSYLQSTGTTSGGVTTYNLPSGLYYVDCTGTCFFPLYLYIGIDSQNNPTIIKGTNVSIIVNMTSLFLGSMNISSPYKTGSNYYPVLVSNGDTNLLAAGSNGPSITLNGLTYTSGSLNCWGAQSSLTVINGAAWASNQLNLFNNTSITFNSAYIQNVTGFNFSNSVTRAISWKENP